MRICVPTETKEGMQAAVHGHFGSSPYFTIYDTELERLETVENTNAHHSHGTCHPIGVVCASSIDAVVCRGMGMRAVQMLNDTGIRAYRAEGATVAEIVSKVKAAALEEITPANACMQHRCH